MNSKTWNFSEEEIRRISRIIEALNQSSFEYLQIESGELKLIVSKGQPPAIVPRTANLHSLSAPQPLPLANNPAPQAAVQEAAPADGTVAIVSPMVGRFYLQPEPGAPPFVTVGAEVGEDSTVGLIEVMKTFNAVRAGVAGVVTEICTQNSAIVEFGQVLLRVQPKG